MGNLSQRHEAFAQAMARGDVTAAAAYRRFYPKSKSAERDGPRLHKTPAVKARIAGLQGQQAVACKLDRDALRQWCERVILAKPEDASPQSDISETVMTKAGPFTCLCSKIAAVNTLIKLCGFDKGNEAENRTADALTSLMQSITARGTRAA